jgi:hypothetical protein
LPNGLLFPSVRSALLNRLGRWGWLMSRTIVVLLVAAVLGTGCNGGEHPTSPSVNPPLPITPDPPVPLTLTISRVGPKEGWPFYYTEVFGTGFKPGVRLTFGGVAAPFTSWRDNGRLTTNPPLREPGTVDVMATNPDGSSVTLAAGFTYKAAILELSKADVGAGESVAVTWSGPPDPSDFAPPDVIGLYAVDDPSNTALWRETSCVCDRSSAQFEAPRRPGVYEVRYYMLSYYLLARVTLVVR